MTTDELRATIEQAFADTPHPGRTFAEVSASLNDEGIVAYFRDTTWRRHAVKDLRRHSAALSFFTEAAFRYWLPAFMLAEVEDPAAADVIADSIAFSLGKSRRAPALLATFTPPELDAIHAFLAACAERYRGETFRRALKAVAARRASLPPPG